MNRTWLSILIIGGIIVAGVAYWLLSPLARTNTIEDAAPTDAVEPEVYSTGSFVNGAHDVSGSASIIETTEGMMLRLSDFHTLNGPDLRLYLATDTTAKDYVDLGPLKATDGNINYDIPPNTDADKYTTVLVWCRAFSVNFGSATLIK